MIGGCASIADSYKEKRGSHYSMVDVLHTVIHTIMYVRSSPVRYLYRARGGMYHHHVASKVIVHSLYHSPWKRLQKLK
jgi:hypothetical protein